MRTPAICAMLSAVVILAACVQPNQSSYLRSRPLPPVDVVQVEDSEFERNVKFLGIESRVGNETGNPYAEDTVRLRSWINKEGGTTTHQVYYTDYYQDDWRHYTRASNGNAENLRFVSIDRDVISCAGGRPCLLSETMGASISDDFLRQNADGFRMQFQSRSGRNQTIRITGRMIEKQLEAIERWRRLNDPNHVPSADSPNSDNGTITSNREARPRSRGDGSAFVCRFERGPRVMYDRRQCREAGGVPTT